MLLHALDHFFALFSSVDRLAITVVSVVSRNHIWSVALFGFGHTECDIALAQRIPRGIGEPRFMTELERHAHASRQTFQEICEHRLIHLEVWRELKQQWPETASALQCLQRA